MSKLVPKYTLWEALQVVLDMMTKLVQEVRDLARTPGPPGPPGRDGFGFDDMEMIEQDGKCMLLFKRGDEVKEFRIPCVIDRGVWRPETDYFKGNAVTWDGSLFIAQKDTRSKPQTNGDWRLAVKRGRDGKDFTPPTKGG